MATEVTITPAAGNSPFPTQGGTGAGVGFDAIDFRRFWSKAYREGVHSAAAWRVTEAAAGAGATVEVAANIDGAFVGGDSVVDQGLYYVAPHSGVISLDVPTPDTTNPRVDRVVLQVRDAAHDGSGSTDARAVILAGTPTAGATKENAAGAVDVPGGALLLATYVVAPSASPAVVANTDILDMRNYGLAGDVAIGEVRQFFTTTLPDGWKRLDGSALRRDQYERLFAEIGTVGGAGDGSSTFNLPDGKGRMLAGRGSNANVDAIGDSDGLAEGARSPKHWHDGSPLALAVLTQGVSGNPGPYRRGPLGTEPPATEYPASWYQFSDAVFDIWGDVGVTSGPQDAPAWLTVEHAIFTGSVAVG